MNVGIKTWKLEKFDSKSGIYKNRMQKMKEHISELPLIKLAVTKIKHSIRKSSDLEISKIKAISL